MAFVHDRFRRGFTERCGRGRAIRYACEPLERRVLLSVGLALSGTQTLVPGATTAVETSTFDYGDMTVDVNPTNPLNIAAVSYNQADFRILVQHSLDGGTTWSSTIIDGADDGQADFGRFDAQIAFDAAGNLFLAYAQFNLGVPGSDETRVIVARSTNGGASFASFQVLNTNIGINETIEGIGIASGPDGLGGEATYVNYTEHVIGGSRVGVRGSNNGGSTWFAERIANDALLPFSNLFPDPAVGPNGELYIVWHDTAGARLMLDRDLDGGFAGGAFGADIVARTLGAANLDDLNVPAQPDQGISCVPVLDVDRSGGPFHGRLYLSFAERFGGNDTDIRVMRSDTDGSTWFTLLLEEIGDTAFNARLAVDQHSGGVHVAYLTTRDDAAGADDVRPYLATSINGGLNFNFAAVSTQFSNATGGDFGDYRDHIGLAVRDGTAHVFWPSTYSGGGVDLNSFTVRASFNSATNGNVLTITGDDSGVTSDPFIVRRSPDNTAYLEVFYLFPRLYTGLFATIDSIIVNTLGGDDTLVIDISNGTPIPTLSSITFNGGTGALDTLQITGSSATDGFELNATTALINGSLVNYSNTDRVILNGVDNPDTFDLNAKPNNVAVTINGGNGVDTLHLGNGNLDTLGSAGLITFNGDDADDVIDIDDADGSLGTNTYAITNSSVGRSLFGGLNYFTAENLIVDAEDGANLITLNLDMNNPNVTLNGNSGADFVVINPDGYIAGATNGTVTLNGGAGDDDLTFDDDLNAAASIGVITSGSVVRTNTPTFLFNSFEAGLDYQGGTNTDNISILSTPAGVHTTVDGNGSNDTLWLGGQFVSFSLDNIDGQLTFHGDAGVDTLNFRDEFDPAPVGATFGIHTGAVSRTGMGTVFYDTAEAVNVNGGSNGNSFTVDGAVSGVPVVVNTGNGTTNFISFIISANGSQVTINGGNGAETLHLGTGNLDLVDGHVTFNGLGGSGDAIVVFDDVVAFSDAYNLNATDLTRVNFGGLTYGTAEQLTLRAEQGTNTINVNATAGGTPVTLHANDGSDVIQVFATAPNAPVAIAPSNGNDTVNVNFDGVGTAAVVFDATQQLGALNLPTGAGATLTAGGAKVLTTQSLAITGTGRLDVTDNDLIVDYTGSSPAADIEADVASGYNVTGDWLGNGITSSAAAADGNFAVAIADNAQLASPFGTAQGGPLFSGADVDLTSVLVKFTHRVDIDLDGLVTPNDAAIFAGNYDENGFANWAIGDLEYDGLFTPNDAAIFGGFYDESLPPV